ncbi:unnamed protein product [Parnassius mnemosyne]|uniref:Uncharacterized protein n=1 Tax=Parnassius mnemosyne TaxID=213953 RepID=A0AAV1KZ16_9NEOP
MHALTILCITEVMLIGVKVFAQNETLNATDPSTTLKNDSSTVTPCITSRGEAGTCIRRERCDYGTPSIDFTLYVPHGYMKYCAADSVCCPPDYIIQEPDHDYKTQTEADFEFDDDD